MTKNHTIYLDNQKQRSAALKAIKALGINKNDYVYFSLDFMKGYVHLSDKKRRANYMVCCTQAQTTKIQKAIRGAK